MASQNILNISASPIMKTIPWSVGVVFDARSAQDEIFQDSEECKNLLSAVRDLERRMPSIIPDIRNPRMTLLRLMFPAEDDDDAYRTVRTPSTQKIQSACASAILASVLPYRVLDWMALKLGLAGMITKPRNLPRLPVLPFKKPELWLPLNNLDVIRKDAALHLKRLVNQAKASSAPKPGNSADVNQETISTQDRVTCGLLKARAKTAGLAKALYIQSNFYVSALHLNLLLKGLSSFFRDLSPEILATKGGIPHQVQQVSTHSTTLKDTGLEKTMNGPLAAMLFMTPMSLFIGRDANTHVLTPEDLLLASKYVGSECPEELHDVNARVFEIVYDLATGALQNDDLPERLVQFLTDPAVVKALERHSSYYEPKSSPSPAPAGWTIYTDYTVSNVEPGPQASTSALAPLGRELGQPSLDHQSSHYQPPTEAEDHHPAPQGSGFDSLQADPEEEPRPLSQPPRETLDAVAHHPPQPQNVPFRLLGAQIAPEASTSGSKPPRAMPSTRPVTRGSVRKPPATQTDPMDVDEEKEGSEDAEGDPDADDSLPSSPPPKRRRLATQPNQTRKKQSGQKGRKIKSKSTVSSDDDEGEGSDGPGTNSTKAPRKRQVQARRLGSDPPYKPSSRARKGKAADDDEDNREGEDDMDVDSDSDLKRGPKATTTRYDMKTLKRNPELAKKLASDLINFIDLTLDDYADVPVVDFSTQPKPQLPGEVYDVVNAAGEVSQWSPSLHHQAWYGFLKLPGLGLALWKTNPIESAFKVMTEAEFLRTPRAVVAAILVWKVLVLTQCRFDEMGFTLESMAKIRPIHSLVDVQDQSIQAEEFDNSMWSARASLAQMVENANGPQEARKPLNALSLPNSTPPVDAGPLNLQRSIWEASPYHLYADRSPFPAADFHWWLAGTSTSGHSIHIDSNGLGSYVEVRSGEKLWIVARPKNGGIGLSSLDVENDPNYNCSQVNADKWTMEGILLTPKTKLIMGPGVPHAVLTKESSICSGGHFYLWETMEKSLHAMIHVILLPGVITNAELPSTRNVLIRFLAYFHDGMILKHRTREDDPNLPSLSTERDWVQLSAFFCIIELLNVLAPETYEPAASTSPLPLGMSATTAHEVSDFNSLERKTRGKFAYARGLVSHSLDALETLYSREGQPFRVRKDLFNPMLAWILGQMHVAFRQSQDTGVPFGIFEAEYIRRLFYVQLEWVAARDGDVAATFKEYCSTVTEATTLVAPDTGIGSSVSRNLDPSGVEGLDRTEYVAIGLTTGDALFTASCRGHPS